MSRPRGRGGNGAAGRGPAGRSNGGGRGPRGSNRGPTTGICGLIVYAPALALVALLADCVWQVRP